MSSITHDDALGILQNFGLSRDMQALSININTLTNAFSGIKTYVSNNVLLSGAQHKNHDEVATSHINPNRNAPTTSIEPETINSLKALIEKVKDFKINASEESLVDSVIKLPRKSNVIRAVKVAGAVAVAGTGAYMGYQYFKKTSNDTKSKSSVPLKVINSTTSPNIKPQTNATSSSAIQGKSWSDNVTSFISDSVSKIQTWVNSFGSWISSAASGIGSMVGGGLTSLNNVGNGIGMAIGAAPAPYEFVQSKMGVSSQDWDIFRNTIAQIESQGRYNIAGGSSGKFDGRYQMGAAAKDSAGKIMGVRFKNDAGGRQSFRGNPDLQEKAFAAYTLANHNYLMSNPKYAQLPISKKLEVLGYAHNQGAGGANKWLNTGRAGSDAFGTSGTKYSSAIAGNMNGSTAFGSAIGRTINGVTSFMGMSSSQGAQTAANMGAEGSNGRLPISSLQRIGIGQLMALPPAANAFKSMREAAFNQGIIISASSAYRSIEKQIELKREKGSMAATPGKSNHGWGLAFDITDSAGRALRPGTPEFKWMSQNAHKFGIVGPLAKPFEAWHWEFRGSSKAPVNITPSANMRSPQPAIQSAALRKKTPKVIITPRVQQAMASNTPSYMLNSGTKKATPKSNTSAWLKSYFNAN